MYKPHGTYMNSYEPMVRYAFQSGRGLCESFSSHIVMIRIFLFGCYETCYTVSLCIDSILPKQNFRLSDISICNIIMCNLQLLNIIMCNLNGESPVINYGEGDGIQNGKTMVPNLCVPPSRQGTPPPPHLKGGNILADPFSMAKTSNTCVKTTPRLVVPPSAWLKLPPPLFCRNKT